MHHRECNNFLLPLLITFLNDSDWQIRADFYDAVAYIASFTGLFSLTVHACTAIIHCVDLIFGAHPLHLLPGPAALEAVVLPCLDRALDGKDAPVFAAALRCVTQLTRSGMLRKPAIFRAASYMLPQALVHVCPAVRAAGIDMAVTVAEAVSVVDRHARLLPILRPALQHDPLHLNDRSELTRNLVLSAGSLTDASPRLGTESCTSWEVPLDIAVEHGIQGMEQPPSVMVMMSLSH